MAFLDGKYICTGTSIPANGFFYESQICEEKDIEKFKEKLLEKIRVQTNAEYIKW